MRKSSRCLTACAVLRHVQEAGTFAMAANDIVPIDRVIYAWLNACHCSSFSTPELNREREKTGLKKVQAIMYREDY